DPFVQTADATQHAQPGQIIVSAELAAMSGGHLVTRRRSAEQIRLVRVVDGPSPPAYDEPTWPEAILRAARDYVHPSVLARLDSQQPDWVAELRQVTAMFVNVRSFDWRATDALEQLQRTTVATQTVLEAHEGSLCQIVMADKGLVLHCDFGLPPLAHA